MGSLKLLLLHHAWEFDCWPRSYEERASGSKNNGEIARLYVLICNSFFACAIASHLLSSQSELRLDATCIVMD